MPVAAKSIKIVKNALCEPKFAHIEAVRFHHRNVGNFRRGTLVVDGEKFEVEIHNENEDEEEEKENWYGDYLIAFECSDGSATARFRETKSGEFVGVVEPAREVDPLLVTLARKQAARHSSFRQYAFRVGDLERSLRDAEQHRLDRARVARQVKAQVKVLTEALAASRAETQALTQALTKAQATPKWF
jgi:hypothetical protein